jgi:hypothetical protein
VSAGEQAKLLICKTNSVATSTCSGGAWCTSSSFAATNPAACSYAAQTADNAENQFYAFVCDDENACSASQSGKFNISKPKVIGIYEDADKNVGIGTTTPSEKLQLEGDFKLNGNIVSDGDICIGECN